MSEPVAPDGSYALHDVDADTYEMHFGAVVVTFTGEHLRDRKQQVAALLEAALALIC